MAALTETRRTQSVIARPDGTVGLVNLADVSAPVQPSTGVAPNGADLGFDPERGIHPETKTLTGSYADFMQAIVIGVDSGSLAVGASITVETSGLREDVLARIVPEGQVVPSGGIQVEDESSKKSKATA